MGDLFRSEEMALVQFFVQPEAAYHIVADLGEVGCVQFRDLNDEVNLFQRKFTSEVKRLNEMERQLRYIEAEIKNSEIPIQELSEMPKAPNPREIVNLEAHLEKTEQDIRKMSAAGATLKKEYIDCIHQKYVLLKSQAFFHQQEEALNSDYLPEELRHASQLGFIAGVANKDKLYPLERLLWRISRGNILLRQADIDELIEDPITGVETRKAAFIVFFQGENLANKILKICSGFKITIVNVPADAALRDGLVKGVAAEVLDLKMVISQTEDHRRRILVSVAKEIQSWIIIVYKMKAIYNTLNMFSQDISRKCLIAEGWVPKKDLVFVARALSEGFDSGGSSVASFYNVLDTQTTPPTFNRTNRFTQGFQNLIASYAFSSYRELNPALYTIITFPFLFAIMFGDLGHGVIVTCFGIWMVLSEKKIAAQKGKNEIFSIFFGGRYIILLMGIFSMYTGFIYNDVFSKSMNIFGTKWKVNGTNLKQSGISFFEDNDTLVSLVPLYSYAGSPYFAGLDPAWQSADNKIIFLNSFKMKLSIIFGVVHMAFGVCLSVVNFVHFKKYSHILLDFLPKILFFGFLFVYLVIMIFMKWGNYSAMNDYEIDTIHGSSCAPNVLIFFIGMMLFKAPTSNVPCEDYMYGGQQTLQRILVVLAVVCIPWMLLGVPIHEIMSRKKKPAPRVTRQVNGHTSRAASITELETIPESSVLPSHEEEPLSDLMVHAGIHTIEFTLSTVSHTASYLRLWALSLAHAQLSDVLWDMVLRKALVTLSHPYTGGVAIYIIFFAWSSITVGILVLMEGLSAFLHTLRLHWVEFMTKFFEGQGYDFEPFSFKRLLEADEENARD
uniref:V-type proton ATPase subunit a n=1 Tax=Dendroctonus ponderosae TaxID=77166 RepID=A0AAR5PSG6_DENPD